MKIYILSIQLTICYLSTFYFIRGKIIITSCTFVPHLNYNEKVLKLCLCFIKNKKNKMLSIIVRNTTTKKKRCNEI